MKKTLLQAAWEKRNQLCKQGTELLREGHAMQEAAKSMINGGSSLVANGNFAWIDAVLKENPNAVIQWLSRPELSSMACEVDGVVFEPEPERK